MVMFEHGEIKFSIDGILQKNLDAAKKALRNDWDQVWIVDGRVGSGKSTLAQQICFYMDPTFNINRICFEPDKFTEQIIKAKKYTAVMYDEAMGGLNARRSMSQMNVMLNNMMAEIRQKNLFIVFVLPSYFDLDKTQALHRTTVLVNVYADGFTRGRFKFYGPTAKTKLYLFGKKTYQYNVKSDFYGRFTAKYVVDEDEYRALKAKTLERYKGENPMSKKASKQVVEKEVKAGFYEKLVNAGVPIRALVDVGLASRSTIYKGIKDLQQKKKSNPDEYNDINNLQFQRQFTKLKKRGDESAI